MTGNKRQIGGVADQNARKKEKKKAPHAPTPLSGRPHHKVWDCETLMLDRNEQEYSMSPLLGTSKQSSAICCLIINNKNRPQNVFPYAHSPETPKTFRLTRGPRGGGGDEHNPPKAAMTRASSTCLFTVCRSLSNTRSH